MIKVIYDGNLGNNLFQYAFGRLLAERLGYRLDAGPIEGFPATLDKVDGLVRQGEPLVFRGQKPDLSLLDREPGRPVLLTGYFQRTEYYLQYRDRIREWLAMDMKVEPVPGPRDLVVGIRRGRDYIPEHGLPMSYYEQAIESVPFEALHICSDSPKDPFVRKIARRYGGKIRPAGALDNLKFMMQFQQMVISNSTFLWWAAFLSDANIIVYHNPANGFWSDDPISKKIDLKVPLDQYRILDCGPYRSEFVTEKLDIAGRKLIEILKRCVRPYLWFRTPPKPTGVYQFQEEESEKTI